MSTLNAFYVRIDDPDRIERFLAQGEQLAFEPDLPFCAVERSDDAFDVPRDRLEAISRDLGTDVIWLTVQTTVNALRYIHWQAGKVVRELVHGCDREPDTWERVDGAIEPWEATALFEQPPRTEKEQRIEPGGDAPHIVALEAARGVARYYGFPGWNLEQPDDREDAVATETPRPNFCRRCDQFVDEPNPQISTVDYARFWRGQCPRCEAPLIHRSRQRVSS